MSLWDDFRKNIEKATVSLDFWDDEENKRQRSAIEQRYTPPKPSNTGLIPIGQAPQQNLVMAKPQVQPDLQVAQPTQQAELTVAGTDPIYKTIDKGLDAGQSWEDISKATGADLNKVKEYSQRTRPNYGVKTQTYLDYRMTDPQNKKIFGIDVSGALGDYGKTYTMKVDNPVQMTEQDLLTGFDYISKEGPQRGSQVRDNYVNKLRELAGQGNNDAKFTLDTLERNGKLKGGVMDFIEGSNQKLYGGLGQGGARTVDFVVPGDQGLDKWADNDAKVWAASTDAGKAGETAGSVQKGVVDVASLVIPGAAVDKFVKGTRVVQGINTATKGGQALNYGTRIIPGSLTATGIDMMNTIGRGDEVDPAKSLAVGTAVDLGVPVLLKGVGKLGTAIDDATGNKISKGAVDLFSKGGETLDALKWQAGDVVGKGKNQIDKLLKRGSPDAPTNVPVKIKFGDELRTLDGINPQLHKVSSKEINLGSDTLGNEIDPKTVEQYIADIKAGKPIDPLVVTEKDGAIFLQDGKHRMAALNRLGIDELPVVTRDMSKAAQATPVGVAPVPAGAKQNTTQSIKDLLPDFAARQKQAIDPITELSQKYGVQESTIRRLQNGYGETQTRNILARSSDATNIRNMDAFVTSEAKKAYGSPSVQIARPDAVPVVSKPLPDGDVVDIPVTPKVNPVDAVEPPESKLGNMVDEFYQSKQGNQRIKYRELENLGKNISKQVDEDFKAIGTDFATVSAKVQEGARNGVKTLDEAGLSPAEAGILRKAQAEMNYVRRRASLGKREVGGGNFDEMYLPQQKPGEYGGESLFEGFRDTKPGNEFTRKNKIELEDLDYSPQVIGDYITRYGDTKLFQQERLARALAKRNEGVDQEIIDTATQKLLKVQDDVNAVKTKIGAFGLGTKKQVADGEFIDTAKRMTDIGNTLGHKVEIVSDAPKGLTNGDRINSISINGEIFGDRLGLNQYRDAQTYASRQFTEAAGDREKLSQMVAERLQKDYNIHPDDLDYAVGGISRIAPDVPDEAVLAKVTSTYQQAAKQQLLEELQHVDITNPKLRKDVSNLTNQILREGSIENELSQKVVSKVLQAQNALFRKLNVSSAINELSDLNSFISVYGKNTALIPDMKTLKEFGLGEIDPAIEPYIRQLESGAKVADVLKSINSKTNLYRFVEHYKAGVLATSAKNMYGKQGLTGDVLTAKVLDDYRKLALPVDAFTKTFLDNAPLYTQYMTWGVRNLQKEGRLATGKIASGVLEDKTTMQRIARNAYANLPAKTVFWLASNGLKGTGILTAFGLTDFTGMTNQDYSGIAEEDKSWYDKTTQFTNQSTTLSMLNSVIQSVEKEQLKEKYKDANYNPYKDNALDQDIIAKYTPQFIKNITGTNDMMEKGYSENKGGRVQYEAPTDFYNTAKSYLFGKSQTDNAREYGGRQDILKRLESGTDPITALADMAREQTSMKDTNYKRPLTEEYSKAYKEAEEGAQSALLQGGRQYNQYLDDLKTNNPEAYDSYIGAMDGNHVNPEYWKAISKDGDLSTFKMMGDRKKQAAKDLGKTYDPLYDLTDEQAKSVLQQKSVATGDDIALRNALYKEKWYTDYMDKVKGYYDQKTEADSDYEQSKRVVEWYGLNDQYNALRDPTNEDMATNFPLIAQQKAITAKYGFGSEEGKNWFRANGDAYQAEKAGYDTANLDLINKMRAIEGYPPMSAEQYQQVTEVADTSGKEKSGYSSSKKDYAESGDFGKTRALELPSVKIKVNKIKMTKPKVVKIQRKKIKA